MLKNLDAVGRENWASHTRALLFRYGFGYVWIAQDVGNPNYFIKVFSQRVSNCYRQNWLKDINTSSKALHYKEFKSVLDVEFYLKIEMPYLFRKVFANFRCSCHKLMVEKGRHLNIERNQRFVHYA